MNGFVKLHREGFVDLMNHPHEFHLLTIIAIQARRTPERTGLMLQVGEAIIGNWESYGFSQMTYRTTKKNLEKWGFATFKATSQGTIAKLTDSSIYDINILDGNDQTNEQVTSDQRAPNDTQECKKEKKAKKDSHDFALRFPEGCSQEVRFLIEEWFTYKDQIKSKLLPSSKQKFIDAKSAWDVERLRRAVDFSISNGYKGIFEPKENLKPFTNGHPPAWKLEEQLRNVTERFKTASESERETLRKQADELKSRLAPA